MTDSQQSVPEPLALRLPTDRVPSAARRRGTEFLTFTLGPATLRRLEEVSRGQGVTRRVTLLAVFQLVLGRYAGVQDVGVDVQVRQDDNPDPGPLVVRGRWEDGQSFAEFLRQVQQCAPAALGSSDTPDTVPPFRTQDLSVAWEAEPADGPGPVALRATAEYDADLLDRATVARMATHYVTLLESALASPQACIADLAHTTPEERALSAAWGTEGGAARAESVVAAFHAQAEATPDAVALVYGDETVTYARLRKDAAHVAHLLNERGIGTESVVGLAMERSASLVVAMLGVLTAGAAYLPLDPGHPEARLAFMVEDSGACLVLADRDVDFAGEVPVMRAAELSAPPADLSFTGEVPAVHPEQQACVLYTSGSTGRPKGVAITHRGIVRLVCDADYLGFGPGDVVAQVANTSFDAATWEIWGALLNGARLVGIRKDEALTPDLLRARIEEHGVTAMLLTTALFHRCVDTAPAMFAPLRTLFFGGEAADARRVAALRTAVPGLRLVNAYGPTEGTTIASTYDVVDMVPDAARVPIGLPIADTRLHVLDRYGREAGIGVPGELYIGGAGLARGYVGRPDLTAERFVPSPFGVGERLYRTGDVVRRREDGVLEYLGRTDTQVKIRGVRIEPDEIASVLSTHQDVRAAVVDVQGAAGSERLVAYVVPRGERSAAPRELRAHLAARLPDAMVPARYVTLSELPVTPNGKLDRRALPAPSDEDGVQAETYIAPRGATEELVAQVWGDLLGVPKVSAHDDFFALGGHSLLATQAVARVAARLGVELGVRAVFEAPTVKGFAARAVAARRGDTHLPVVSTGDGPHRLSFAQQRLWFLDRLAPGSPLYNVPLVLCVDGPLDVAALGEGVRELVRRHASLRTRLVAEGDEPLQVVDADAHVPVRVEDLRHLPQAEREREADDLARREAQRPFDLARGPMVRVRVLRLAEERHLLLLTMHHAVSDGWSVGVLIRDLGALYTAARGGTAASLPALPVQYADYAAWQRRFLDAGAREEQLAYWKDCLAGAPACLELPTDRPRPPAPRHSGEVFALRLTPGLTERLGEVSRAHGVTRFMTLLAVFQLVLGRYAGTGDVSVGTPVSGRTRPEFEDLVGFFVNTLVLRTCWEDGLTFAELLARVRETTLGAYEHQDVPFEQVVEAVRPPRDPSRTPLFQVMLAMQNAPAGTTALPGLTVSLREGVNRAAKFDLTVAWEEASLDSGELHGSVEYDVDLFDRATVERMMRHYITLLDSALATPDARLTDLEMIGAEELAALVGPEAEAPAPPATTLHGLVDAAAARAPEHTALVHGDRSIGYAELRERSDAVCAHLRAHGVGAGDTVVVRMDRCLEWPAALLGVLKAGAAYVPVDLGTPPDRLGHVLRDAQAALVLGSRADGAPPDVAVPFVAVEDAFEAGAGLSAGQHAVHPAATAYVLYTSGTTGRPKGVCVSHANLVHTLEAVAERYGLGPRDRVLQFASLTFDVAAEELFASLVRGATVVLLPTGPVPGIDELTSLAERERLSVLNLPGSYWHEWVSALDRHPPAACHALRLVVVGSERVDGGKLAEWQATAPAHIRLLNAYGPTETTITATVHEPRVAVPSGRAPGGTVPIGRPLPGVRAYVLDAALRPVPQGVPGDLYIAGSGVSRGYLGDPGRTAGSFLPDPWGRPGERMYATRDRARRGADGELEFLGRTDDQIKLRGFRIELGEIEAALAAHPRVRDAAAVLREDTPGRPALVGYVALAGATSEAELRAHLEQRLPSYMVPTAIVTLDRLPRNERGKTDRRALPPPARPERSTALPDAPMGDIERLVAGIWREVLAAEHVGVDDNFFELGGHSLLVVRVQSRLTETLGTAVPMVDLFRYPTVRTLARHLAAGDGPTAPAGGEGRRRAAARRQRQGARAARTRRQTT
ncbi:amino acid adenylation domain-containing protein [Streptomyces coeruleorubidus]|uniref:amino acid adenylation domain-containing protein n=1 Tax=Streptomyces coeruleorubidus TaxID=116188 RepID=UPI0033ABBD08